MLSLPPTMKVFVAAQPADMRKSFDGLVALVHGVVRRDPLSGHLFCFFNRRRTMMKAVYWDRTSKAAEEPADARYTRRQRDTVPRIDELEDWVEQQRATEPRDTLLGKALTYYWNHRDMLRVVIRDGELELDNGEVEREIRGPAMGRRNWLFAGSDEGAERAAIILTVLKTAKRAGIDVRAYLQDVLTKLSSGWLMSRLDELLPENWQPPGGEVRARGGRPSSPPGRKGH